MIRLAGLAALVVVLLTSCSSVDRLTRVPDVKGPGTSSNPATAWQPPANAVPPATPIARTDLVLPANFIPGMPLSLAQVVDIALSNNTATRIAWLQARSSEAALGSRQSAYLPEVDVDAALASGRSTGSSRAATALTPSATLSYLLFDFGGRAAQVEEARQGLIAADFLHNQTIQDVVLRTQQAYYSYLDSKALLAAQDSTLKERQTELNAAEARHDAGVATIADVLQARTALSQAQLNRESIEGNLRQIEGVLATTMGLPAATRFEFGNLPLDIPVREVNEAVDALIDRAVATRPDLAAARAFALRAGARVRDVRSEGLPTVALSANAGRSVVLGGGASSFTPYTAAIGVRWPIFTGFRNQFDVRQAEIDAQVANEDVRATEQQVNVQVWTAYYALQTAAKRFGTTRDLLASAQQSVDVATNRYRAGVGGIVDVLTAEAALESARAQEVQARTDWFLAVAQLAHDTGTLGAPNTAQGQQQ